MTGQTTSVTTDPQILNKIKTILVTRQGDILLGTTTGLFVYNKSISGFDLLRKGYVRSLYEDSRGYIWIGTWGRGFFTLNMQTKEFSAYDAVCQDKGLKVTGFVEDKEHRIWVSTWDNNGMIRLEKPFEPQSSSYQLYPSSGQNGTLPSAVLYKLAYDPHNNEIWVATAKWLFLLIWRRLMLLQCMMQESLAAMKYGRFIVMAKILCGLLHWEEESIRS